MKTDESGFASLLKNGIDRNIYFIYGDDDYLKAVYCEKLTSACVAPGAEVFNFHRFSDDEKPLEDIFEIAAGYPMMSDKMCLLIRNYNLAALKKDNLDKFIENLKNVPETSVFVFYFDTLEVEYGPRWRPTSWNAVIDLIDTVGVAAEINRRTPEKLASLLVSRASSRGTEIDRDTAVYLVESVGTDMRNLLNEFNKVCAYSGGKKVTREMIDGVCVKSVEADVFMICDSIFSKNNDRAYAVMNELLRLGVTAQEILGAMNSTFVNLYRIKVALNSSKSFEDVVALFAMNKGQAGAARRLIQICKPMRLSSVRDCLSALSDADMKIKRSSESDSVILTELIARLCGVLKDA